MLRIEIQKGSGLLQRDSWGSGDSDPYVIVLGPDGQELLKTPTIDDNLNPVWHKGNVVEFRVGATSGFVKFTVWDEDVTTDEFLGEASLSVADMVRNVQGSRTMPLQPRQGEPDKIVRENAGKLGTLTVKWNYAAPTPTPTAPAPTPTSATSEAPPSSASRTMPPAQAPPPAVAVPTAAPAPAPTVAAPKLPGNLRFTVRGCSNLMNRETFGTSDPYVQVLQGEKNTPLLKTIKADSTLDPVYPPKKSTGLIRVDANSVADEVAFEVWDANTLRDDFMGEARVVLRDVARDHSSTLTLRPRANEPDAKIAAAVGKLGAVRVDFEYEVDTGVAAPGRPVVATATAAAAAVPASALPPEPRAVPRRATPGMLTLCVARCINLANREATGTSDPYCVVFDPAGREILRTPVVNSSLNPEWERDTARTLLRVSSDAGAFRIHVFDKNVFSDDFMGEATLPVVEVLTREAGHRALALRPRSNETDAAVSRNAGSLGHVVVDVAYSEEQIARDAAAAGPQPVARGAASAEVVKLPGTLVAQVVSATGLMNREVLGTSDPYVIMLGPDGSELLRTPSASSTLSPVWQRDDARGLLRVEQRVGLIRFHIFDKNVTSDAFMGEATIAVADVLSAIGEVCLQLQPRENEPDATIARSKGALGTLTVAFSFVAGASSPQPATTSASGQTRAGPSPQTNRAALIGQPGRLTIKVLECANLPVMDTWSRSADPFVKVLYDGQLVFRTTEISKSLNPAWSGTDGQGSLFVADVSKTVELHVFDADATTDEIIGTVSFVPQECEQSGQLTLPLRDEAGKADGSIGTITFKWVHEAEDLSRAVDAKTAKASAVKEYIDSPGKLTLRVESAAGLVSRALMSDTPSVAAMYCGREVFASPPKKGLSVSWEPSEGTFELFIANPNEPLVLQVRDGDKFQGEVVLDLPNTIRSSRETLSLRARKGEEESIIISNSARLGTITLSWHFEVMGANAKLITEVGELTLQLVGVRGLVSRELLGNMKVFAVVRCAGSDLLRTTSKSYDTKVAALDWDPSEAVAHIPIADPTAPIEIEVHDEDLTTNDFLGLARIVPASTARNGESAVQLRPRRNERDAIIRENADRLGTLVFRWHFEESDERRDVRDAQQKAREVTRAERQKVVRPVRVQPIGRVVVEVLRVSNLAFRLQREEPEVSVSLTHRTAELRCVPTLSMPDDPATFPTPMTATFTPDAGEDIVLRVFDAEESDGLPLGLTSIPYAASHSGSSNAAETRGGDPLRLTLSNAYGAAAGEATVRLRIEPRAPTGEVRVELRETKNLIASAREVYCTASVGDQQFTSKRAIAAPEVFFGTPLQARVSSVHEELLIKLHDAATNRVIGEGSVVLGREGKMWVTLTRPTAAVTTADGGANVVGVLYVAWKLTLPDSAPVSSLLSAHLATPHVVAEVVMARDVPLPEDELPTLIVYNKQHSIVATAAAIGGGRNAQFFSILFLPTAAGVSTSYDLEVQDRQKRSLCVGQLVLQDAPLRDREEWLPLELSDDGQRLTSHAARALSPKLLMRISKPSHTATASASGGTSGGVGVVALKPDLLVRLQGAQLALAAPAYIALWLDHTSHTVLRSVDAHPPGAAARLDQNFHFAKAAVGLTPGAKRLTLHAELRDGATHQPLARHDVPIVCTRRSGPLTLNFAAMGVVDATWLWLEGPMSAAERPITSPDLLSVSPLQVRSLRLPRAPAATPTALIVEVVAGPTTCRTAAASLQGTQWSTGNSFDFAFDPNDDPKSSRAKVRLLGVVAGGREETLGTALISAAKARTGQEWLVMSAPKSGGGGPVAELLVDIGVTRSVRPEPQWRAPAGAPRGSPAPAGVLTSVVGPVGRPFNTRLEEHEVLATLLPYLERHFGVAREEQEILHRGRVLDPNQTLGGNGVSPATAGGGAVELTLACANRRTLILQVKLPSGRTVPLAVTDTTNVWRAKALLCEREGIDGLEGPSAIRFMANYSELQDDATIGFYKLRMGAPIVVVPKPKHAPRRIPARPTDRLRVVVEDTAGNRSVIQLDPNERISTIRGVVDADEPGSVMHLSGELVTNEGKSLAALGAANDALVQLVPSPHVGGRVPPMKRMLEPAHLTFDVEEPSGAIFSATVRAADPISVLRREVEGGADPHLALFYNGRQILHEGRSFAELELMSGGFIQLRAAGAAGGSSGRPSSRRVDPDDAESSLWRRQRRGDEMRATICELQQQLQSMQLAQQSERALLQRIGALEKELEASRREKRDALDRVAELEEALRRSHVLLRRTADVTRPLTSSTGGFGGGGDFSSYMSTPPRPTPSRGGGGCSWGDFGATF